MDWKLVVREREESKHLSSWEGSGAIYEDGKSKERSRFGFGRWESTVLFWQSEVVDTYWMVSFTDLTTKPKSIGDLL